MFCTRKQPQSTQVNHFCLIQMCFMIIELTNSLIDDI